MVGQIYALCSLDSFCAAGALALLGCPSAYRRRLAAAFFVCDALGAFAGASFNFAGLPFAPMILPLAVIAACVVLAASRRSPALLWLLPVLLCADNLLAGTPAAPPLTGALVSGVASGTFAWLGFSIARPAVRFLSPRACWALALAAVSLAVAG